MVAINEVRSSVHGTYDLAALTYAGASTHPACLATKAPSTTDRKLAAAQKAVGCLQ